MCPNAPSQPSQEVLKGIKEAALNELTDEEKEYLTDEMVARFYRATHQNKDLTIKRLVVTSKWRHKERPHEQSCVCCEKNPRSHWMHTVGYDKLGRPVLFTSFIMVVNSNAHDSLQHMMMEFERAIKLMGPDVSSWVWFIDFRGFGRRLGDLNPALALKFQHMSATHYPERLGLLYIIDAPGVVYPLWNMVRSLMDPAVHHKIQFVHYDLTQDAPIPDYIDLPPPTKPPTTHPDTHQPTHTQTDTHHAANGTTNTHGETVNGTNTAQGGGAEHGHAPHGQSSLGGHEAAHGHSSTQGQKPSELWSRLCSVVDQELAEWFVSEMRCIRDWDHKRQPEEGRPTYEWRLLEEAAKNGSGRESLTHRADGHSHYGPPSHLATIMRRVKEGL